MLVRVGKQAIADVEAYEDGTPLWNVPVDDSSGLPARIPAVVRVADVMAACGMFKLAGLKATTEIWGQLEFRKICKR